jgi:ribosomal RNA assembly protein
MQYIKLPKDRVGVIIGRHGDTKQVLEDRTGVEIDIDSETGEVAIATEKAKDPVMAMKVFDIIRAIGRGFSPERALRLFDEDVFMRGFDIRDYVGKNPKHVRRLRARLIGTKGKTRRLLEELTDTEISIYGNTVYVIGALEELGIAETAVDMILSGSEHAAVYRFLEGKQRSLKMSRLDYIDTQ